MRYFNPPPNWPPPPPGWVPDSEWSPDPSWPPAPPGWQLWVDEPVPGRPVVAVPPPGIPPQPGLVQPGLSPTGVPPQWGVQPQPPAKSRKALWIALAAAVVAIVVAGAVLVVGATQRPVDSEAAGKSRKPAITELSKDLLVDRSAFPDTNIGKRSSGLGADDGKASALSKLAVEPEECADFYGISKTATQTAYASVAQTGSEGPRSLEVHLSISPNKTDLKEAVQKCDAFTVSLEVGRRTVTLDAKLDALEAPDVPSWAVAAAVKSSSTPFPGLPITMSVTTGTISGYYRGVLIVAGCNKLNRRGKNAASIDASDVNDLTKLFNAQVEQLEAAP